MVKRHFPKLVFGGVNLEATPPPKKKKSADRLLDIPVIVSVR